MARSTLATRPHGRGAGDGTTVEHRPDNAHAGGRQLRLQNDLLKLWSGNQVVDTLKLDVHDQYGFTVQGQTTGGAVAISTNTPHPAWDQFAPSPRAGYDGAQHVVPTNSTSRTRAATVVSPQDYPFRGDRARAYATGTMSSTAAPAQVQVLDPTKRGPAP